MKTLSFHVTEEATRFLPVPRGFSYRDAIELLKKDGSARTTYTP
jgi:hypothetical protein